MRKMKISALDKKKEVGGLLSFGIIIGGGVFLIGALADMYIVQASREWLGTLLGVAAAASFLTAFTAATGAKSNIVFALMMGLFSVACAGALAAPIVPGLYSAMRSGQTAIWLWLATLDVPLLVGIAVYGVGAYLFALGALRSIILSEACDRLARKCETVL